MTRFRRYLYWNYDRISAGRNWLTRRLTPTAILLMVVLVAAGSLGADTSLSLAYQAFAFLLCLLMVAWASRWFFRGSFGVRRDLPRLASIGVTLAYEVKVTNQSHRRQRGLWLMEDLEDPRPTQWEFDHIAEPDEARRPWPDRRSGYYRWMWITSQKRKAKIVQQPIPDLPPSGEGLVRMEFVPRRRGVLAFRGATVACPDVFGIFRTCRSIEVRQTVLILPKRYKVPVLALAGTRKYQPRGVALASSVGESEEFMSLRDYRPGDPWRHIHWNSWAKTGKPIVKEFADEFFVRHALVLDTFTREPFSELLEEAVAVAASFVCALPAQDALLDLLFVGPQAYCFTSGRGLAQAEQMLEILAAVPACMDRPFETLQQLVFSHAQALSGCICVFLAWDQLRQELVSGLKALGIPMRVFVVVKAGETLEPGPLSDQPECFHPLEIDHIQETLNRL
ncbi:MAG TPA: DUF58 domain-containing protein [Candidatus Paceibacterota bacterium]|nr:DUF58 domain-containing protein [Verrucomicrobiota bacterium]HRY51717.1 DUF58 domain-containing protein [Candidatus Paceibacterota bacterium]